VQQMVGPQPTAAPQPAPACPVAVITAAMLPAGLPAQSCPAALTDKGNSDKTRLAASKLASIL